MDQKQELPPQGPAQWPGHQGSTTSKPQIITLDVSTLFESSLTQPALRWLDGKAAPTLPKGDVPRYK